MPVILALGVLKGFRGERRDERYAPNCAVALCVDVSISGLECGVAEGSSRTGGGEAVRR